MELLRVLRVNSSCLQPTSEVQAGRHSSTFSKGSHQHGGTVTIPSTVRSKHVIGRHG